MRLRTRGKEGQVGKLEQELKEKRKELRREIRREMKAMGRDIG